MLTMLEIVEQSVEFITQAPKLQAIMIKNNIIFAKGTANCLIPNAFISLSY